MSFSDLFIVRKNPNPGFWRSVGTLISGTFSGGKSIALEGLINAQIGVPAALPQAQGPAPVAPTPEASGGFTSVQSLITFSGSSAAIQATAALICSLTGLTGDGRRYTYAILALIVGILLFLINVTTEDSRPKTTPGWIGASMVAFFNTATLVGAAVGLSTIGVNPSPTPPPATTP